MVKLAVCQMIPICLGSQWPKTQEHIISHEISAATTSSIIPPNLVMDNAYQLSRSYKYEICQVSRDYVINVYANRLLPFAKRIQSGVIDREGESLRLAYQVAR